MPYHLMGRILNKSSWARLGLDASMTTNIEPGWKGYLTLELHYARCKPLFIPAGVGIAQVIFEEILCPVLYKGKYQDQKDKPVAAILT
jgi:dCTP deaminase